MVVLEEKNLVVYAVVAVRFQLGVVLRGNEGR